MLVLISLTSILVSALQLFGIVVIAGTSIESSILLLSISIMQAVAAISNYVIPNATLRAFSRYELNEVINFNRIELRKLITYSILVPILFSILNNIIINKWIFAPYEFFGEKSKTFMNVLEISLYGIPTLIATSFYYSEYRFKNKLAFYEAIVLFSSLIGTIGMLVSLRENNLINAAYFLTLKNTMPAIFLYLYSINKSKLITAKNFKKIKILYKTEAKKLFIGSAIFKLMMPFDRFILALISPTAIVAFSVAQQLNSIYDILINKVIFGNKLNKISQNLNKDKNNNKLIEEASRYSFKIILMGLIYYVIILIILLIVSARYKEQLVKIDINQITIFYIYLIGQPLFSSAAAYINGLFYSLGSGQIAIINGVILTLIGMIAKYYTIGLDDTSVLSAITSIQYFIAFIIIYKLTYKLKGLK
jgi:hypothetical protein